MKTRSAAASGPAPSQSQGPQRVKVFQARENYVLGALMAGHVLFHCSAMCRASPHFQALYHIWIVHVVLVLCSVLMLDSYKAGHLYINLSQVWRCIGSGGDIIRSAVLEIILLSSVCMTQPLFKVWERLHRNGWGVGAGFALLFVVYVVGSWFAVVYSIFSLNFPPVLRVIATIEQMRVCMKSYSFIRENAYKVLHPWHKDDTSGPAVWYQGQMEPRVGSFSQFIYFLFCPTLLYRDHYPRKPGPINWVNVIIYLLQFLSTILFGLFVYRDALYPSSMHQDDLVRSFAVSISLGLILLSVGHACLLHTWMCLTSELTRFADAQSYTDWWNSEDFGGYFRSWNLIVYDWIREYLYTDLRKLLRNWFLALPITFISSSLLHDFHNGVGLGFFVPIFMLFYACIGTIVYIVRPFSGHRAANVFMMFSLTFGTAMFQWYYVVELAARNYCPQELTLRSFFVPRLPQCINS